MKRLALLSFAVCVLFIFIPAASGAICPVGRSYMGCSLPPTKPFALAPNPQGRPEVPDVSDNNGLVNWSKVKRWQVAHRWAPAGIFKMGETVEDLDAAVNAQQLHALGMAAVGYVFVRPGLQTSTVIGWAKALKVDVVVLDEEVAGIQGIAAELVPSLEAAGLTVVDYHSQENVLDTTAQGLPCWTADYGPSRPPTCTTGKTVAWQMMDTATVPGINGPSDLSQTLGLIGIAQRAPLHFERFDDRQRTFYVGTNKLKVHAREREAVRGWFENRCVNPVRRKVCVLLRLHMVLLRFRLLRLHAHHPWSYGSPSSIGARNQELWKRLNAKHVITSW